MLEFLKTREKKILLILCIGLNILLFSAVLTQNVSYFQTNDDYRMRLISSGLYTGDPESQLVFIKSFVGYILQFLYNFNSSIAWYDWFTVLSMFLPVTYVLYKMVHKKDRFSMFVNLIVYILFYALIIKKHLFLPQFTITAAFFAMGAVYSLIESLMFFKSSKKIINIHGIICVFFNLMCFGVRDEISILLFAMELFIVFVFLLRYKSNYKKIIKYIGALVCCLLIVQGIEIASLNHESYKSFKNYTKARSNVYDYYSIPTYEEDKEFYDSLNLDTSLIEPIKNRTLDIDETLDTDIYNAIFDYSKEKNSENFIQRIKNTLLDTSKYYFSSNMLYQTLFVILTISCLLFTINKKDIFEKNIFFGSIGFILYVPLLLCFRGRLVERILESIYLISLPVFFSMYNVKCSKINLFIKKEGSLLILMKISLLICCGIGFIFPTYMLSRDTIYKQNQAIQLLSQRLETLGSYVNKHTDNFYFYNSLDFIGGSDKLFSNNEIASDILNMDSLGNWNAKSDTYYKRNNKFGFTSAIEALTEMDNVYYVECGAYHNSFEELLNNKYKMTMKKVDTIYTSSNIEINIYHAQKLSDIKEN